MKITQQAIDKIRGNNSAIGRLMQAFDRGQKSIEVWMNNKDIRLTTPTAVQIIQEETGLSEDEILEADPVAA